MASAPEWPVAVFGTAGARVAPVVVVGASVAPVPVAVAVVGVGGASLPVVGDCGVAGTCVASADAEVACARFEPVTGVVGARFAPVAVVRAAAVPAAAAEATSEVVLTRPPRLPRLDTGVSVAASDPVLSADLPGRVPFVALPVVPSRVVASRVVVSSVVVPSVVVSLVAAEPAGDVSPGASEAVASVLAFDLRDRRGLIVSGASRVPSSAVPALLVPVAPALVASVPVLDPVPA
ncbi:hypothetical protein ACFYL6_08920, partial [Micromonospora sp. NPDC007208]|uniref:hypothetical protein n=1 Tax=Micromonospora sp. NPDC007208 TaxID=3364236 RepID=UPI0036B1AC53